MNRATFFKKFELLADTPDAVAKMRELVLYLALHGKLVKSEPSAEPPERTFPTLAVVNSTCDDDSYPPHWLRIPLGQCGDWLGGGTPSKSRDDFWRGAIPWVSPKDMKVLRISDAEDHISTAAIESSSVRIIPRGSILMVVRGMILARAFPVAVTKEEVTINQDMKALVPGDRRLTDFLLVAMRALEPTMLAAIERSSHGTCKLPTHTIHATIVAIPPLAEQKRIVAKVDELMALCDQLEAQQQEGERKHAALARASLARFSEAPTPANLNLLFHKSYTIDPAELRQAIITMAVAGKLVTYDPSDESAPNLIRRIAAERCGAKTYGDVPKKEGPHEIPLHWVWVRMGALSLTSDSGWSPQCEAAPRVGTGWGVLKVSAVSWGDFLPSENKALPRNVKPRRECEVHSGDFLLTRANTSELVARSVVVKHTPPGLMMSDKIVRFTFPQCIEKRYINLANSARYARDYYARNASGTSSSMKNVGREVMCRLPIPVPPVSEQRRIVAKVDELMKLVDQLEQQLRRSRELGEKLLEAVVAELTAA